MGLELYLDLLSQPCRAVFLFARRNNIPFELKDAALFTESTLGSKDSSASDAEGGGAEAQSGPRLTLSRTVPLLKDGAFVLAEGPAILLYLARTYGTPDHWYPADPQRRAKVDEYLFWHQAAMRSDAPKALWVKVLLPMLTGDPLPPGTMEDVMRGLSAALAQLEQRFLAQGPFVAGAEVSVADLVAVAELMQAEGAGCEVFEGRPRLSEWRSQVEAAVGAGLFREAHRALTRVRELRGIRVDPRLRAHLAPALAQALKR